jgi:hypothetical protein
MKKTLIASFTFTFLAVAGLHAQLLWFDDMNYPVGNITTNPGNIWTRHSGGSGDSLVVDYPGSFAAMPGHRYEVSQNRSDDVHRLFYPNTNGISSGTVFASFIVSVTNLPSNPYGNYFAHFMDINTNVVVMHRARTFVVVPNNPYPFTNHATGTFRLGIANAQGDGTATSGGPSAIVPLDLALNTDYQVVMKADVDNAVVTLWVNAASEADTTASSGNAFDIGLYTNAIAALSFRQNLGEGIMDIRDVAVGLTFADVMTNTPTQPLIGLEPSNVTNFSGNAAFLEIGASGIGLTYQWVKDNSPLTGATSQMLLFDSLQGTDQGSYYCTISSSGGTTNSDAAYVAINNTPTAPVFTTPPQNTTNYLGETATLTGVASGTGPLSYQWQHYGTNISDGASGFPGDTSVTSGSQSPYLTISSISTNQAGTYTVVVTGGAGNSTSTPVTLAVLPPRVATIGFLRTLLNTTTFQPSDKTTLFNVTGIITTFTNTTTGNTASYYIQDGTGGINLFVSGTAAPSFRPQMGDLVTASGTLLTFNNNLEIECLTANPYQAYSILSHNNTVPAPKVLPFSYTNNVAATEVIDGSLVMFTNIYFVTTAIATANRTIVATNSAGNVFQLFFPATVDQDLRNRTLPAFAWTVTGFLSRFNNAYELNVTRFADVVGTNPPPFSVTTTRAAGAVGLSWDAVPYNQAGYPAGGYSYSVYAAGSVAGPYLPLVTGMTFTNTAGTFTDPVSAAQKFYKLSSP